MAENNSLTIQNENDQPHQFLVTQGSLPPQESTVAVQGSWDVPQTYPCDQWVTVEVVDAGLTYQTLNARVLIFASDGTNLSCLAGDCEGGCQVNEGA